MRWNLQRFERCSQGLDLDNHQMSYRHSRSRKIVYTMIISETCLDTNIVTVDMVVEVLIEGEVLENVANSPVILVT